MLGLQQSLSTVFLNPPLRSWSSRHALQQVTCLYSFLYDGAFWNWYIRRILTPVEVEQNKLQIWTEHSLESVRISVAAKTSQQRRSSLLKISAHLLPGQNKMFLAQRFTERHHIVPRCLMHLFGTWCALFCQDSTLVPMLKDTIAFFWLYKKFFFWETMFFS